MVIAGAPLRRTSRRGGRTGGARGHRQGAAAALAVAALVPLVACQTPPPPPVANEEEARVVMANVDSGLHLYESGDFVLAGGGALDAPGLALPRDLVLVDADADGDLDLVTTNAAFVPDPANVTVFSQVAPLRFAVSAQGSITVPGLDSPEVLLVGDMDRDGEFDLVTVNAGSNTLSLLYGGR